MMKKRILGGTALVMIIVSVFFFIQLFSVPSEFLTEEEIQEEVKAVYKYSAVTEVQEIIRIDERNAFVPLLLENGNYALSTWTWVPTKKWKLQSFDSNGSPQLWNIGDEDERYFIWNMPVDEQVAGVKFYLIRDRNAWISGNIPVYLPRIQLEHHVSINGKGHGVLKMPKEWVELSQQLSKDEAGRTKQLFQSMFSHNELVQYGWRTVDHRGQLKFIEMNVNNSSGFADSNYNQMILPLYEGEIEFGK